MVPIQTYTAKPEKEWFETKKAKAAELVAVRLAFGAGFAFGVMTCIERIVRFSRCYHRTSTGGERYEP